MKQKRLFKQPDYEFINKALYINEIKTLIFGDMHLGHEFTFRDPGSFIPKTQLDQTKKDIKKIFETLEKKKKEIKKVIFLGDIKHFFSYEKGEKNLILEILYIIGQKVPRKDIIILKGNHEKMAEIADKKLLNKYIIKETAFIHGDSLVEEIFKKEIKTIIMGHLHPAITLTDSQNVKKEKYKCYLTGKYKKKQIIILPSFLPTVEGTSINEYLTDSHCIIPKRSLKKFKVLAIGDKGVLDFGFLKDL